MSKLIKYLLIIIGICASLYLSFLQTNNNTDIAQMIFFDIGQGDSILIITPENEKILIDGGPGNYLINEIGKHLSFYDNYIDVMILTHAHDDHVSGLNEILKRYDIGLILYPGDIDYGAESYLTWLGLIKENELNLQSVDAGVIYNFSSSTLEILYPFVSYDGRSVDDVNATSIVAKFCYIEVCLMLTGDATATVEQSILESGQIVAADILKVAHHGSQYSNTEAWLQAVNSGVAIIQSGLDNKFNHPHLRVIKRLNRLGIEVLRNDLLGEIIIATDGEDYWLNQLVSHY